MTSRMQCGSHSPPAALDDYRGICLKSVGCSLQCCFLALSTCVYICIHVSVLYLRGAFLGACAMIIHIVGTRAEASVAEQKHNCSPILSVSDLLPSPGRFVLCISEALYLSPVIFFKLACVSCDSVWLC